MNDGTKQEQERTADDNDRWQKKVWGESRQVMPDSDAALNKLKKLRGMLLFELYTPHSNLPNPSAGRISNNL